MANSAANECPVSRSVLVAVVKLLCLRLVGQMSLLKAKFPLKYSAEDFIDVLSTQADKVRDLPKAQTRRDARMAARAAMEAMLPDILESAQMLEIYIRNAYPANAEQMISNATISTYYRKVSGGNWDACYQMLLGMTGFIATHTATLSAVGSMPADFPGAVGKLYTDFNTQREINGNSNGASKEETKAANAMILALYQRAVGICTDLVAVHYKDKALRKSFAFAALRRDAAPKTSVGGIRGGIVDAVTSRPLAGVVIRTAYFDKSTKTRKDGRFDLKPLPEGQYDVEISVNGYGVYILPSVKVATSIMTTLPELRLSREPMPAVPQEHTQEQPRVSEVPPAAEAVAETPTTDVPQEEPAFLTLYPESSRNGSH